MSTFFESRTSFSISIPFSLPIVSDMVTLLLLETTREQQFWIGPGSGAKYAVSGPQRSNWAPPVMMLLVSFISYLDRNTLAVLAPTILKETRPLRNLSALCGNAFCLEWKKS